VKLFVQCGEDIMSKMGKKPILVGAAKITIDDQKISYEGKKNSGEYILPEWMDISFDGTKLIVLPKRPVDDVNRLWGMHRALLANAIIGSDAGFERQIKIVGLGFKAIKSAIGMQFSLGFSHKIDFPLPAEVLVEIDKTGQLLTCRSHDKAMLGLICSKIRALRPAEPYKGTGIQYADEVILRKAGKTK
jgi:large subunit ribosomal protein L6